MRSAVVIVRPVGVNFGCFAAVYDARTRRLLGEAETCPFGFDDAARAAGCRLAERMGYRVVPSWEVDREDQ